MEEKQQNSSYIIVSGKVICIDPRLETYTNGKFICLKNKISIKQPTIRQREDIRQKALQYYPSPYFSDEIRRIRVTHLAELHDFFNGNSGNNDKTAYKEFYVMAKRINSYKEKTDFGAEKVVKEITDFLITHYSK